MSATAAVEIRRLWLECGSGAAHRVVLENLDLRIEAGECCSLVGAAGIGKSSLLRLLAGQEKPSRGRLLVHGIEPGPRNRTAWLPSGDTHHPHLNVRDHVLLSLELSRSSWLGRLFGEARAQAHAKAEQALREVGLGGSLHRYPAQLSANALRRLALAQVLALEPRLLLLDEPFASLPHDDRRELQLLLLELWQRHGFTLCIATDQLSEGFRLGTRLLTLDKVRVDYSHPEAYGSRITYDIRLNRHRRADVAHTLSPDQVEALLLNAPAAGS